MIRNFFKIAYRNLWNHKFYTFINVFGLALSISCSIILFQFIKYHSSFDRYHHDAKQVYRVVHRLTFPDGIPMYNQGAPLALAHDLKATEPRIKDIGVLLRVHDINVTINQEDKNDKKMFAEHENIAIADDHFFNLFDYEWEQGDKSALANPNTVVLSHSIAQKYFADQQVIGKTITVDNKNTFTVSGVIKDHVSNTDIKADIFLSLPTLKDIYPNLAEMMIKNWDFINTTNSVFLQLRDGVDPQLVEKNIAKLNLKAQGAEMAKPYHFMLLPLSEMHFDERFAGVIQHSLLTTLGIIGLLLMVIACVNFINMATAQSFKRAKEIGTRKVLGSTPFAIFAQFIAETASISILAVILAFAMVFAMAPVLNSWLQTSLDFNFLADYRLLAFALGLFVVVTMAAGSYPALILSKFKPVNALKNQVAGQVQSGAFTRKGLIVFQNVIAQVLIIGTILITMQLRYLKTADPGFSKDAVLMVPIPDNAKGKTEYLRNQLQ
ncbi:MAG TPA: ABC transporter permease, partial [Mucilaginibacter sp.]